MSFFIIDPNQNTVAQTVVPGGTNQQTSTIQMTSTVVFQQGSTTVGSSVPVRKLTDNATSYTLTIADEIVDIYSSTYRDIYLYTAIGSIGKRILLRRQYDGDALLTIHPWSSYELINGQNEIILYDYGQSITLVSDDISGWYSEC